MSDTIEADNPEWKTMTDHQGPEWRECSMFVLDKLRSIDETTQALLKNQGAMKTEVAVIKAKAATAGGLASALLLGAVELFKYFAK